MALKTIKNLYNSFAEQFGPASGPILLTGIGLTGAGGTLSAVGFSFIAAASYTDPIGNSETFKQGLDMMQYGAYSLMTAATTCGASVAVNLMGR
jgi:hypothetical protein